MEYNSQLILSNSQEARLAEGIEEGFLAAEWFNDFSENESETDDTSRKQAPFIALDSGIEGEEGQNSEEWSNAMDSFGSRRVYNDRVQNFMAYAKNDASQITLEMKLIKYFDDARKMKTDKGEDRYRATSFRSWLSVFCKFWKHCKFKELKTLVPALEDRIGKWEKLQNQSKQAKTFTGEELLTYYNMPNTPENLVDKVYAVIAISFAARGIEVTSVNFENVTKSIQISTGETQIKVTYLRTKTKGVPETTYTLITWATEVRIINEYEHCYRTEDRKGRYFRMLKYGVDGTRIMGTAKNIGHNTTAKTGIRIANRLGLENPELYTGHTFRRTAATICAESGMTLPEIKLVTGKPKNNFNEKP